MTPDASSISFQLLSGEGLLPGTALLAQALSPAMEQHERQLDLLQKVQLGFVVLVAVLIVARIVVVLVKRRRLPSDQAPT